MSHITQDSQFELACADNTRLTRENKQLAKSAIDLTNHNAVLMRQLASFGDAFAELSASRDQAMAEAAAARAQSYRFSSKYEDVSARHRLLADRCLTLMTLIDDIPLLRQKIRSQAAMIENLGGAPAASPRELQAFSTRVADAIALARVLASHGSDADLRVCERTILDHHIPVDERKHDPVIDTSVVTCDADEFISWDDYNAGRTEENEVVTLLGHDDYDAKDESADTSDNEHTGSRCTSTTYKAADVDVSVVSTTAISAADIVDAVIDADIYTSLHRFVTPMQ